LFGTSNGRDHDDASSGVRVIIKNRSRSPINELTISA
jgi:hypothetical protein